MGQGPKSIIEGKKRYFPPESGSVDSNALAVAADMLASVSGEGTAVEGEKKPRGKKEPFRIDYKDEVDFDSHLKNTRAATTLTKATLVKYSKSQTTLPKDLHYNGEKLFKLSLKPKLMVSQSHTHGESHSW